MINLLLEKASGAGYANPRRALAIGLFAALALASVIQEWLRVPGLTLAVFAGAIALGFEYLAVKAQIRSRRVLESWPIVIESLESAAVAGMSLLESLRDLGESEQLFVANDFSNFCRDFDSGAGFDQAIIRLKRRLSCPAADFTLELIRVANTLGSSGYVSALRNQSSVLRGEATLSAEIAAKQGWVVGTAKLAVLAPWLIVLILSFRPENAQLYSSSIGTLLLVIGLIASAVALRMVYRIGSLNFNYRVFK